MITFLVGKVAVLEPTFVEIETHGIGYRVHISLHTFTEIKNREQVRLLTHLHVREDAQILYGFGSERERTMFHHLTGVNGIGPNTAMIILSCLSATELHAAIMTEDLHALQSVKGIGRKSAQRIVLELREKLSREPMGEQPAGSGLGSNIVQEEALAALMALGLTRSVAEKSVRTALQQAQTPMSLENLVKLALKNA